MESNLTQRHIIPPRTCLKICSHLCESSENSEPEDGNYKTYRCSTTDVRDGLICSLASVSLPISLDRIDYAKTVKSYNILASTTKSLRSVLP